MILAIDFHAFVPGVEIDLVCLIHSLSKRYKV
jgi:hypothetical protein